MSATDAVAAVLTHAAAPLGVVAGVHTSAGRDVAVGGFAASNGTKVTRQTAFDLASVTKVAATTTVVLRLVQRGELRLDDEVSRWLPMSGCAPGTTIRHLLLHRSGLWEWQPLYLADVPPLEAIAQFPLRYGLDEARHYSDLGFQLLGAIVERATGTPLAEAVRALVTDPLGLEHTRFGGGLAVAASSIGDAAERRMVLTGEPYPILVEAAHFRWREHEITGDANDGNCFHAFGGLAGHAGLFSTADDLLTLGAALAAPEEHAELWPPDLVAEFFADGPDQGQALGWRSTSVMVRGSEHRMVWHPGFTGCALGIIPTLKSAVVLLSNRLLAATPARTQDLWLHTLPHLLGGQTATEERTTTS